MKIINCCFFPHHISAADNPKPAKLPGVLQKPQALKPSLPSSHQYAALTQRAPRAAAFQDIFAVKKTMKGLMKE